MLTSNRKNVTLFLDTFRGTLSMLVSNYYHFMLRVFTKAILLLNINASTVVLLTGYRMW